MKTCCPTFTKFTTEEIITYARFRKIKLDKGWTLHHSWCELCGTDLVVAVRDTVKFPEPEQCATCKCIIYGDDLDVPNDDIEMTNFYLQHRIKMEKWTETCRD